MFFYRPAYRYLDRLPRRGASLTRRLLHFCPARLKVHGAAHPLAPWRIEHSDGFGHRLPRVHVQVLHGPRSSTDHCRAVTAAGWQRSNTRFMASIKLITTASRLHRRSLIQVPCASQPEPTPAPTVGRNHPQTPKFLDISPSLKRNTVRRGSRCAGLKLNAARLFVHEGMFPS